MNRLIIPSLLLILLAAQGTDLSAQCLAGISVDPPNGSQNLTIQFTGEGIIPGTEYPCDDPLLPAGWSSTPFTIGSPCLVPDGSAPDGSDYLWVGARDATGKRWVETSDYDMSGGGTIFFEIRYGTDVSTDCPGPNRTDQGVSLEYSINGGADWSKITYYTPYSTDTTFTDWNSFEYLVPAAAQTTSTRFRWYQNSVSNDLSDKWGLNNINITSIADVTSWEWDFGDMATSDQQNPEHTFATYGVYSVSLTITTAGGCTATETTDIYINSVPTIDDLTETDIPSTGTGVEITLTGITDGGVGGQTLLLSATSSNPASLTIESVDYTSPATTGIIRVTPDSLACGDATITARVEYTNLTTNFYDELFTVHVTDNTLPWITCPEDMTINLPEGECTSVVSYDVEFGDNCPGATIEQTAGLPSGSPFPSGTTINSFVVTDAMGNQVTCAFIVSVTEDIPPEITCPEDIVGSECNNNITIT
ncbi:MAG: HYR domain-containing protein, partial [Bacteroidales bacterium]|nr:HYR domain-containing protein [Bacteroidales bacterium]